MTKLKIDYSEARKQYIKGYYTDEGRTFPSLPEIAREFNYSLSTLTKHAAIEMPANYSVMLMMALVPPIWFFVMDKRIDQLKLT